MGESGSDVHLWGSGSMVFESWVMGGRECMGEVLRACSRGHLGGGWVCLGHGVGTGCSSPLEDPVSIPPPC